METKRAFIAIVISMIILLGYQYLLVPQPQNGVPENGPAETTRKADPQSEQLQATGTFHGVEANAVSPPPVLATADSAQPARIGRDISVETELYTAVISETGGGVKSFKLKNFKETLDSDTPKELVLTESGRELPLYFSWGTEPDATATPVFDADQDDVSLAQSDSATLTMKGRTDAVAITRSLRFNNDDYMMELTVDVHNISSGPQQGTPYLSLTNRPFSQSASNRFLFNGPAVFQDGVLQEVKVDDLQESEKTLTGKISWAAYEDTYFMCAVIPRDQTENPSSVRLTVAGEDKVTTQLSGQAEIIPPGGHRQYQYSVYFGPKKLSLLKKMDGDLNRIVDFGWWDIIAKPTLYLLNFLYKYIHNYGVAIILVTIIIKMLFWPISHKGMKSMKTMQKIQPKIAKLREKYKDDRERLNQEMVKIYKTYKINPLGGCLPMVLQIPVFFALYKVLLQTIELRHAPFMLWINDLSAPDRLFIGFDIPYLGGIPVLTLLMGASMFLQQKMTPTAADPTQAKVMMFLPLIFTFMFINFASGLVLYWFVNNLLSIAQQYVINRQVEA